MSPLLPPGCFSVLTYIFGLVVLTMHRRSTCSCCFLAMVLIGCHDETRSIFYELFSMYSVFLKCSFFSVPVYKIHVICYFQNLDAHHHMNHRCTFGSQRVVTVLTCNKCQQLTDAQCKQGIARHNLFLIIQTWSLLHCGSHNDTPAFIIGCAHQKGTTAMPPYD